MTTLEPLDIGDTVSVSGAFVDRVGQPMNPAVVTFVVTSPAHVQTAYVFGVAAEVTNPAVGTFVLELPVVAPTKRWYWRLVGAPAPGQPGEADQGSWYVREMPS